MNKCTSDKQSHDFENKFASPFPADNVDLVRVCCFVWEGWWEETEICLSLRVPRSCFLRALRIWCLQARHSATVGFDLPEIAPLRSFRALPSKVRAESGICLAYLLNWRGGTAQLWAGDHRDESEHGMVHINSRVWPYHSTLPRSAKNASQIDWE